MKKLITIALIAISAMSVSAQMMTSRTLMKKKNPATWYVRTGLMINNLTGLSSEDKDYYDLSAGSKAGFDLDFGFNKPIGKSGAYWGMDLGLVNRGGTIKAEEDYKCSYNTWSIKYSPITFGYKYAVTNNIKIDGHLGGYLLGDISQKSKINDISHASEGFDIPFDAGIQIGVGAWYKKLNLDFSYQRGFVPMITDDYGNSELCTSAFVIRLGLAF